MYVVPAPLDVAGRVFSDATLYSGLRVTALEVIVGFGLAVCIGVPLAILVTMSRLLSSIFMPLILLTQSIPKVALAPVLVVALGYGFATQVTVAFLVCFFPMIVEFVGSNSGLGFQLLTATARFDGTKAFAAIVILSVMSLVLYGAVGVLERILVPWHGKA